MTVWVVQGYEDIEGVYASVADAMRAAPTVRSWHLDDDGVYQANGESAPLWIFPFDVKGDASSDQPLPVPVFMTKITEIERIVIRFPDPVPVDLADFTEWQTKADAYAQEHDGQAGKVYFERLDPDSCSRQVCCFRMAKCPVSRHRFSPWEIDNRSPLQIAELVPA